jgi:hypothetical protein
LRSPRRTAAAAPRALKSGKSSPVAAAPVTAEDLRALRRELERRMRSTPGAPRERRGKPGSARGAPSRWNPEPEDVQKSVAQLVLTLVEFLRKLMERQAIRRMEQGTLSREEVERIGAALMKLEETVREIGKRFGLSPEELNLDLGPVKLM